MATQTDFHPRIHGFDFDNHWDLDENYRQFVRDKIREAWPIIGSTLATNPVFTAALVGGLGSAYGVGQVLLPGIFDTIAIPVLINQLVTVVDDKIHDFLPDHYGACGGMAFVALDYYYYKWPIPKGICVPNHIPSFHPEFIVPRNSVPEEKVLRDYIYKRHRDTWNSGGVLYKTLEWFVILKSVSGGGFTLREKTKAEWTKLTGLLDLGKPQPLAIIFDEWDIFKNHQLVAYNYTGNPYIEDTFIDIYDNRNPNEELQLKFNFKNTEIDGRINIKGNPNGFKSNERMKGFFCTDYSPEQPPISWGLEQGLWVTPSLTQSTQENFHIRGQMSNGFHTFKQNPSTVNIDVLLTPIVADAPNLQITPANFATLQGVDSASNTHLLFEGDINFNLPSDYIFFSKVSATAVDRISGAIILDAESKPLTRILYLPGFGPGVASTVQLHVIPRLAIIPYNKSKVQCYHPYIEKQAVVLMVEHNPFPSAANLSYEWTVPDNIPTGKKDREKLEITQLPDNSITFNVKVVITNKDDGAMATGDIDITPYTSQVAERLTSFCEISHILFRFANPRFYDPLGPDTPFFRNFIEENLREIGRAGQQLHDLSNRLQKLKDK